MIEKIPYLKALGVTAVELLPVFEFDERECAASTRRRHASCATSGATTPTSTSRRRRATASTPEEGTQITEFRDMVKALHKAGIEVILDVVFNHTAEGNHMGPTISFKGLENDAYYLLDPTERSTTWTTPAAATR